MLNILPARAAEQPSALFICFLPLSRVVVFDQVCLVLFLHNTLLLNEENSAWVEELFFCAQTMVLSSTSSGFVWLCVLSVKRTSGWEPYRYTNAHKHARVKSPKHQSTVNSKIEPAGSELAQRRETAEYFPNPQDLCWVSSYDGNSSLTVARHRSPPFGTRRISSLVGWLAGRRSASPNLRSSASLNCNFMDGKGERGRYSNLRKVA